MTSTSRILVAVDFSASGRTAFDAALALSREHGAELVVVHAVPADEPFDWHGRERSALISQLRDAAEAAGVRFRAAVQHGDPTGVILLHAGVLAPDLLVVGSHQRTGLARLRRRSVASRVARRSRSPVMIVPYRPDANASATSDTISDLAEATVVTHAAAA